MRIGVLTAIFGLVLTSILVSAISDPSNRRAALNRLAGPVDVYRERQGVLSVIIEYTRLSKFLSQLAVGKSGAAFFLIGTAQSSRRRIPTPTRLTHQRPISRCCRSPTARRGRRQVRTTRIRDRRTGSGRFGMGKLMG
jgi:hypothetical protein